MFILFHVSDIKLFKIFEFTYYVTFEAVYVEEQFLNTTIFHPNFLILKKNPNFQTSKYFPAFISEVTIILTVTGESTLCTFDSSTRISRAFEHKALTSNSLIISQRRSCSICLSKSLII